MKKTVLILLVFVIGTTCALTMVACNNSNSQLTMYVPDGAPALAVANVMASGKMGNLNVTTHITTGEDVVAKCAGGKADLAILPINAAANICTKNDDYLLLTVNTWGLLYVVGTHQAATLADLAGKTVTSIGLANTPEYVFKKILSANGVAYTNLGATAIVDKVNIDYVADGTTIVQSLVKAANSGAEQYGVLGEPAATNAIAKASQNGKTLHRLFNLQTLWQSATNSNRQGYPQAGLVVKKDLLTKRNATQIVNALTDNLQYVADNAATLDVLMAEHGSTLTVKYTADIISRCNLAVVLAADVKQDILLYLQQFNVAAIQNLLPNLDKIYYEQNA